MSAAQIEAIAALVTSIGGVIGLFIHTRNANAHSPSNTNSSEKN